MVSMNSGNSSTPAAQACGHGDSSDTRMAYLQSAVALFEALQARQAHSPDASCPQLALLLNHAASTLLNRARLIAGRWEHARSGPQAALLAQSAPIPPAGEVEETLAAVAMAVDYLRHLERHLDRRR